MAIRWTLALTALASATCGCANYTKPQVAPPPQTQAQKNFDVLWQASQDVLREYYFTLDRQDRRAGVITTQPLVGEHWFEFWRHDAATRVDLAEGSLQTIYRSAKITLRPTSPDASAFVATVEVTVQRSDMGQPQITSTSEAYNLFTLGGGDYTFVDDFNDTQVGQPNAAKVELGRDNALERKLATDIRRKAERQLARQ